MFQNLLSPSPWIWISLAATMVALPILIHLITHLRYRPVRWAAMDFLMSSYRQNRRRVWLKQLLLIAARITALVLILLTVAQIGCNRNRWATWFGGTITHHYVVVDDSYSMGEQLGGDSPLTRAHGVIRNLAAQLASRDNQRLTVIRLSQAWLRDQSESGTSLPDPVADPTDASRPADRQTVPVAILNGQAVDRQIPALIESLIARLDATSLACGPRPALELAADLIRQRDGETPVVYMLSDFRNKDWASGAGIGPALQALRQSDATLELVRCCDLTGNNLAITDLRADGAIRVAGVPLMMRITVQNFGNDVVRNLQIRLATATYTDSGDAAATAELVTAERNELPVLLIEKIDPGEVMVRRFPVFFGQPGQHEVFAELPADSMAADNRAWAVNRITQAAEVLVVDDPPLNDSPLVTLALNPGGMTGIRTVPATRATLRDASEEALNQYETVFLLDIDRLDADTANRLHQYVSNGGGLVFFAGPDTSLQEYTRSLYDQGQGIYPAPLERVVDIPLPDDSDKADIAPAQHPVFSHVLDVRNSPLDLVQIHRICQPPQDWSADADQVQVLATVRGQSRLPLILEKQIGAGRVVAVLSTAGPAWNNWCRNGTWPASLLLIQDHVSRGRGDEPLSRAGRPVRLETDGVEYQREFQIVGPGAEPGDRFVWQKSALPGPDMSQSGPAIIAASESTRPGIYEIWRRQPGGSTRMDRLAVNVDVTESEPQLIDRSALIAGTREAAGRATSWQDFQPAVQRSRSGSLVRLLLAGLVLVLAAEQLLALLNSYHS